MMCTLGTSVVTETPPELSLAFTLIRLPKSASDERIVARISTPDPSCVVTITLPNLLSSETMPPRNVKLFRTVVSKSSACADTAASAIAIAAACFLLIRNMRILPEHFLQRPLLLHVHGQELLAQMRVLPVLADIPLAFGDGVIEQHQLFLVADHEWCCRLLEPGLGDLLQLLDRLHMRTLRLLDLIECRPLQNGA